MNTKASGARYGTHRREGRALSRPAVPTVPAASTTQKPDRRQVEMAQVQPEPASDWSVNGSTVMNVQAMKKRMARLPNTKPKKL